MLFLMELFKRVVNKVLRYFELHTIPSTEKVVYLTFDDGPEEGITEFVLDEMGKYGFRGTFFCRGDNAEINPHLLQKIIERNHSIGNHTYSHIHSYEVASREYVSDVERASVILKTDLFRPPHGSLTFQDWSKLKRRYKIISWSLNSGDSNMNAFDFNRSIESLKTNTKRGDIVLFHFCHRHEKETIQLLPIYLKWLHENGYESRAISNSI